MLTLATDKNDNKIQGDGGHGHQGSSQKGEEAVKAYAENDAYQLKFYHFAGEVDMAVSNRLQAEHTEYLKELDELDNSQIFT